MTRGKHGAQADRRRAEATNTELERLRDQVAQWKRLNKHVTHILDVLAEIGPTPPDEED